VKKLGRLVTRSGAGVQTSAWARF